MGKRVPVTDAEIFAAYGIYRSIAATATALGISATAVQRRIATIPGRNPHAKPPAPRHPKSPPKYVFDVLEDFNADTTYKMLARKYRVTNTSIRHALCRAAEWLWGGDNPDLPIYAPVSPHEVKLLRVYNALRSFPELFDNPEKLAEQSRHPLWAVKDYLDRTIEWQEERTKRLSQQCTSKDSEPLLQTSEPLPPSDSTCSSGSETTTSPAEPSDAPSDSITQPDTPKPSESIKQPDYPTSTSTSDPASPES